MEEKGKQVFKIYLKRLRKIGKKRFVCQCRIKNYYNKKFRKPFF